MNFLARHGFLFGILAISWLGQRHGEAAYYVNQQFANSSDLYVVEGKTLYVTDVDSYCQYWDNGSLYNECSSNISKTLNLQNISPSAPYANFAVGASGDFSAWSWSMTMSANYPYYYTYSIPTQNRSGNQGNRIGKIILSNFYIPIGGLADERTFYILENSTFQVGVVATNYQVL